MFNLYIELNFGSRNNSMYKAEALLYNTNKYRILMRWFCSTEKLFNKQGFLPCYSSVFKIILLLRPTWIIN